jgi:hypothetical protein
MAPTNRLLNHFESLVDPRTPYLIEHRLLDIIGLTICAVVCGAESWVEVSLRLEQRGLVEDLSSAAERDSIPRYD